MLGASRLPRRDTSSRASAVFRTVYRTLSTALIAYGLIIVSAGPALAGAAQPTNYESVVLRVSPAANGVSFEVVGGDAFLTVAVERSHEVLIPGYFNEPYVRIDADGSVYVNENSQAFFINEDRYGRVPIPAGVDLEGEPAWSLVATDGRYAWLDHRIHWMSEDLPPAVAGDQRGQVFPWEIPVMIDGVGTSVSGELVWIPSHHPAPSLMAGLIALLPMLFWRQRRSRLLAAVVLTSGAIALAVTVAQNNGTPDVARGFPVMVTLPVLALALGAVALVRAAQSPRFTSRLVLVAGVALTLWSLLTVDVLWLPVLPSEMSPVMERAAVAFVLWSGIAVTGLASVVVLESSRQSTPAVKMAPDATSATEA